MDQGLFNLPRQLTRSGAEGGIIGHPQLQLIGSGFFIELLASTHDAPFLLEHTC
jgi:hypothetical protein